MADATGLPVIRVLHNMARSGGTLISRCLGCMDGVVLLSEIHPLGGSMHNPLQQAYEWFGLFDESEVAGLARRTFTFIDAIRLIHERVSERGGQLVIRDWSHIDFTGVPFVPTPSLRLMLAEQLSAHYDVRSAFTVRHPLDQWVSLNRLSMFRQAPQPRIDTFCTGYLRFAEYAAANGFVRYEDFVSNSERALQQITARLSLAYDPAWCDRWRHYHSITGDNTTPTDAGRSSDESIRSLPRQPLDAGQLDAFRANAHYRQALEVLGYAAR